MELTPLDVRKKREDFGQRLRGYDPQEVESFLQVVADRLEELVRENRSMQERIAVLEEEVERYREREKAINEALMTAQELREEARTQAEREAELTIREAEARAERIREKAQETVEDARRAVDEMRGQRAHFVRSFRSLLEGYLGELEAEKARLEEEDDRLARLVEIQGEEDGGGAGDEEEEEAEAS